MYTRRYVPKRPPQYHCAVCGDEMPNDRIYMSAYHFVCAGVVSIARRKVVYAVKRAVRTGKIPDVRTLTCVDCGKPATDYDHRRYMAPLDVEPTCRSCNLKRGPAIDVADLVRDHFKPKVGLTEFMREYIRAHDAEREAMFNRMISRRRSKAAA